MELWDIYNVDRQKTPQTTLRGDALSDGQYHLVVHIGIFNSAGELLIQQRQPWKEGYPNLWDLSAAGSAQSGENSAQAAARELREEVGIVHDFSQERPFFTVNFPEGFDDYYFIQKDVPLSELRLQKEEVQAVRWASLQEIETMLDTGEFIPYYRELVRLWFTMRHHRGSTIRE